MAATQKPLAGDELKPYEKEDALEDDRCPECGEATVSTPNHEWCIRCAQDVRDLKTSYERHAHPTGKPPTERLRLETRFWSKVDYGDCKPNECWEWRKEHHINPNGYGYFWLPGGKRPAHRVALALDKGLTNPDELPGDVVRHLCDGPKTCCNPNHLETGTQHDNMDDYVNQEMDRENDREFSPDEIREIHRLNDHSAMTQSEIAGEYDTSQSMVSTIVRGEQYAWVE